MSPCGCEVYYVRKNGITAKGTREYLLSRVSSHLLHSCWRSLTDNVDLLKSLYTLALFYTNFHHLFVSNRINKHLKDVQFAKNILSTFKILNRLKKINM